MAPSPFEEPIQSERDRHPALERSEMWTQLTNAIRLRSSEDQVLWSIFGTFWAANAVLLVALFTTGDLPANPVVGIVVSAVGTVLSVTWHAIQHRALGHLMKHEELMRKLETDLGFDPDYAVSAEINRRDYDRYLGKGPRARKVMPTCSLGAALLWALVFAFFLCRATR